MIHVGAHDWTIDLTEGTEGGARFEITGVEFSADSRVAYPVGASRLVAITVVGFIPRLKPWPLLDYL